MFNTRNEAVSKAKAVETASLFDKGIGRFEKKASFTAEAVYKYSESQVNGGRKSPF